MAGQNYVFIGSADQFSKRFPDTHLQYEGSGLYNSRSGAMMDMPQRSGVCRPHYIQDIPEHEAPSGRFVSSRSGRREEIKRSEGKLIEWEPITDRPRGVLADRKFAEKMGGLKKGGLAHFDEKAEAWVGSKLEKMDAGLKPQDIREFRQPKNPPEYKTNKELERATREILAKHGVND